MKESKTLYYCDVCGEEIEYYRPNGTYMINGSLGGQNQAWSRALDGEVKTYDVCKNCCQVLWKACMVGIIDLDISEFFPKNASVFAKTKGKVIT